METLIILLFLFLVLGGPAVIEHFKKNLKGAEFPDLPRLAGHQEPFVEDTAAGDGLRWDEMEPEEDPQPARFRPWGDR